MSTYTSRTLLGLAGTLLLLALAGCETNGPIRPIPRDPVGPIDSEPAWSPDGQSILYTHSPQDSSESALGFSQIWRLELGTGLREFVTTGRSAVWSPDGDSIALEDGGLVVMDLATKIKRQIGPGGGGQQPTWSFDGRWIAYSTTYGDPRGSPAISLIHPDGSGWRDISQHGKGAWMFPCWSPDGGWLVHLRYEGLGGELFVMDSTGAQERRLTNDAYSDRDPAWSPDGQWIAWSAYSSNSTESGLWLMHSDGTNRHLLIAGGFDPTWAPDGSRIAFAFWSPDGSPATIWSVTPGGLNLTRLTPVEAYSRELTR